MTPTSTPPEVEAALDSFPGVRSSAVIGLPDDNIGNRLHAIIDRPEGPADTDALMAHPGKRLVRYKTPRTFEWVSEPLRDEAGKVRRNALRKDRLAGVLTVFADLAIRFPLLKVGA